MSTVQFEGIDSIGGAGPSNRSAGPKEPSSRSLASAPSAPPHEHRRTSIQHDAYAYDSDDLGRALSADRPHDRSSHVEGQRQSWMAQPRSRAFGGLLMRRAYREIRQDRKKSMLRSARWTVSNLNVDDGRESSGAFPILSEEGKPGELDPLSGVSAPDRISYGSEADADALADPIPNIDGQAMEVLKAMFMENKINVLLAFLPLAYWSHAANWSDGSVFILNFIAMVPLAAMLGVFTEELAAHTNDVIGGLINATFGNAVELVVAIQALLANDFRVVQASLIGSVFSNLLLVLGMCFLMGGMRHKEQRFIADGAVASIALLAFNGLTLLMPEFFGDGEGEGGEDAGRDVELSISRIGAILLILMYAQLLIFQLKTHVYLFEGDDDVVALIPFNWALIGLVVITGIVTILSEWLVGSIDGFCDEFGLGRSFVGVIILPVVGNAVEHISAVSVAMKNKMDLALGVALGSAVQIALFVLPVTVAVGWFTGREMSLKFPPFEVYLFLLSVVVVSLCLGNQRSNWLEGSLLIFTYVIIAVGIYFEKDVKE